jgi:glycosyltransferase involved in cell wall biosynthesis
MPKIRYFRQSNRGAAAARNAGVRQSRGDLLAFLDNDDIWLPDKLELQVRVMQESPQCGLVFSDGKTFTADGVLRESILSRRLDRWIDTNMTRDPMIAKGRLIRELLFSNEIASASSVMVRRECFERSGGFDEAISIADDYDLWLRLARIYEVALIRRCLYMWRWRDDSQSGPAAERRHRWTDAGLMALEKQLPLVSPDVRAALRVHMAGLYWECARYYFDLDQFAEAKRRLWSCLRHRRAFVPAMGLLLASHLGKTPVDGMRRVKRELRSWSRRGAG